MIAMIAFLPAALIGGILVAAAVYEAGRDMARGTVWLLAWATDRRRPR